MARSDEAEPPQVDEARPRGLPSEDPFAPARFRMVQEQLSRRDIVDPRVVEVMGRVPRHEFVDDAWKHAAYADRPLPIGHGQTISQPYIVALMTQLARAAPSAKALEIGTGSGYQTAILAELCREVYSIEIVGPLAIEAAARLERLGYENVHVRSGDGYRGWPEAAPFEIVLAAAAPERIPQPLLQQLAPGGRLVIPVGRYQQELLLLEKRLDGTILETSVAPVAFVPMTGEAEIDRETS